ncbi:MAG: DUF4276 family protein [Mariprofundus sp.]|nr:DUF4276 family protein [Mariprofundus sp.]
MSVKLFVEGGAKGPLSTKCRAGFASFLQQAGFAGHMPKVFSCGSRQEAYNDFCTAIGNDEKAILLVDSESSVSAAADKAKPWLHVQSRAGDGWARPAGVADDQLHFMVICMEAWFLTDKEALSSYFGQNFNVNALSKRNDIELISKSDIYLGLSQATKNTKKGEYGKGKHSFEILAQIDPEKVRRASPYADRFLNTLNHL